MQDFARRKHISFPLLSDAGSAVIRRFGILNHNIPETSPVYGIPFPGQYLVDRNGVVQAKFFEASHRERMTMSSVLVRSTGWRPGSPGTVETGELLLEYVASQKKVRPGNHVTLLLTVTPKQDMYIYAPGAAGYRPASWTLKQAGTYRGRPAEFPRPTIRHMAVLNEKVPVYEKAFRMLQDVEIAQKEDLVRRVGDLGLSPGLVLEGTFSYQACDKKRCYIPRTLTVTFPVQLEDHDWIRATAR